MNFDCPTSPENKKKYLTDIGKILVKDNGKKKYYKSEEVKKAHYTSKWFDGVDFSCWAMSTFSSQTDFNNYHQQIGETCDYVAMKTEMLQGLSLNEGSELFNLTNIDANASWLDFGEAFGKIFDGIGDFVAGIFEVN